MGEKRQRGNWDRSKRDDGGRWPSKSPRHWGQQNHAGYNAWREEEHYSMKPILSGWGDCYYTTPLWERTFCTSVCRVPWRKICDANRVMYIYKNVAEWDDSIGREEFQNAKARYWAKINNLPCDIPLPDPYMYIDKVNFDAFIDPELAADLERSFFNPDDESAINHLDSSEHEPVVPAAGFGEAEHSSSNWDKHIEKPVPGSSSWGHGINVQSDSWEGRRNHLMDVNEREIPRRVSWKDEDEESWRHRHQESWKNGEDGRNSDWKCMNSRYSVHDNQVNSGWKYCGRNNMNNHSFEKKVQPQKAWQRGQFLGSRNQHRTGYSGAQFQRENAVS